MRTIPFVSMPPQAIQERSIHDELITLARAELGVKEVPGASSNPRIDHYASFTGLNATSDEVPWCSSFCCFVVESVGLKSTRSAAARSWVAWGEECQVEDADVLVFGRLDAAHGHVCFRMDVDRTAGTVTVIGGNQGNSVSIITRKLSDVIAARRASVD